MELFYLKSSVLLFENVTLLGNGEMENFPFAIDKERALLTVKQWSGIEVLVPVRLE